MWHREDNTHALDFAVLDGNLYFVNAADNKLDTVTGSNEGVISWYAESGDLGCNSPDNKCVSKIILRVDMDTGSELSVSMQFDSDNEWRLMFNSVASNKRSFSLPIIPRRCDHFRIKFSGKGGCKIYSISKVIEQGSEL
jgi:hypothetical protein